MSSAISGSARISCTDGIVRCHGDGEAMADTTKLARPHNLVGVKTYQFCRTAVKAELQRAGTVPPEGMVDDTCRCFVAEVQNGAGIQTAQATCKAKAAETYGL